MFWWVCLLPLYLVKPGYEAKRSEKGTYERENGVGEALIKFHTLFDIIAAEQNCRKNLLMS